MTIPFGVIALAIAFVISDSSKYLTNHTSIRMERDVLKRTENGRKDGEATSRPSQA